MKILQILPALEQGGVEWDAVELALELQARGVPNGVASAGGGLVPRLEAAGVPHHALPLATKSPFGIFANARRIARLVRDGGYDLVHVRSRAPAWSVRIAARRAGFPWLATYHGVYGTKPPCLKLPYNRVMLAGLKTICVSDFVRRHVESVYNPAPGQLVTIHDGADTARFRPDAASPEAIAGFRREHGFEADAPLIVMAGRLTRWKGQHILLAAAARMRHERFGILFVGSDQGRTDYSAELRALAAALPHGRRVAFLERSDDMPLVYAAGDVAVNASSGQPEAFGRVIPEAQATGRIVVGTAHGGACETIEDGVTGFLVPPGDVDALAARLDAVFDMGRDERSRMQAAAVRSVSERFSVAVTCERTIGLYRDILSKRGGDYGIMAENADKAQRRGS